MPIRSSAGVNWAGIVLSGRGNADLHPDEDLPCWPFLCHSPVLLLPPWLHSPYRGGQKRFSMTVGDRVSGVNGKWPDFSAPSVGISTVLILWALLGCLEQIAVEIHLSTPTLTTPLSWRSFRAWLGSSSCTLLPWAPGIKSSSSEFWQHHGTSLRCRTSLPGCQSLTA